MTDSGTHNCSSADVNGAFVPVVLHLDLESPDLLEPVVACAEPAKRRRRDALR